MNGMKAAKEKTLWLVALASALLFCASALASSHTVSDLETRAELLAEDGQDSVERPHLTREIVSRYYDPFGEVASEFSVAPNRGAAFKTWNQFQAGTKGQFASRAEAGAAWRVYKEANGIVTGSSRSEAVARQYLRSLAGDYRTPSWMKPWLQKGRRPPGYEIDHIKPLSIGGEDVPANMRLQEAWLHDLHHKHYDPWNW
jgi:hypothetical protein